MLSVFKELIVEIKVNHRRRCSREQIGAYHRLYWHPASSVNQQCRIAIADEDLHYYLAADSSFVAAELVSPSSAPNLDHST